MRHGVKNLRRQKHVAEAVNYVRHVGGEDVKVRQNGHLHVDWTLDGRALSVPLPARAANPEGAIQRMKQDVRRACREHGVEVRA